MNSPDTPSSTPSAPSSPSATPSAAPSRPPSAGGRPGFAPRGGPGGARPGGRPGEGGFRGGRRGPPRRKVCRFCADKVFEVDYKAVHILRGFLTARGKLLAGRTTGNCARHQRQLTSAVKRAQNLALLPFTGE